MAGEDRLLVRAPAKINLNLLVGPVREDGYHPLDSYVTKIALYDEVILGPADGQNLTLTCQGAECGPPEQNLAYRAALLLAKRTGRPACGEIRLHKNIPPGKGLGGGSSDAAAVLWGLNRLWQLDLSDDDLSEIGLELGSDVPLFLGGPASRMTGRGEFLTPIRLADAVAVLIVPELHCATGQVYGAYDQLPRTESPQLPGALLSEHVPARWRDLLVNDLEPPARAVCPELGRLLDELRSRSALKIHMSGSGSAVFLLADDAGHAQRIWRDLPKTVRPQTYLVRANDW